MTDLTEISGVGPSYAETLDDAGYESAEDVADADPEGLDDLIETVSGDELVENASAVAESETTEDADPAADDYHEIDPGFSESQEIHLLSALVDQEIQARRTNDSDRLDATVEAIREVRGGEPYEMTLQQFSIAYTATNQMESEYRGTRALSDLAGEMRELSETFQQLRRDNWPDGDE